jgi:ketosteroid isomerase-like protein
VVSTQSDTTSEVIAAIERFNGAVNSRDPDAMVAAMTEDCIFETTLPPPDGQRFEGRPAVRAFFANLFGANPQTRFDSEELFAAGDRCVVRWVYNWVGEDGEAGHVRGVDVFRVRDGKVAEKLSYVKG